MKIEAMMWMIEAIGSLAGILSAWLCIRTSLWLYPWSLLNCLIYMWICYQGHLYGQFFIQMSFTWMCLYGWTRWFLDRRLFRIHATVTLPVRHNSRKENQIGIFWTAILSMGVYFFIYQYGLDPHQPMIDAYITASFMVGTFWMIHKRIEAFILFGIADLLATWMYIQESLWISGLQYAVLTVCAILGWMAWKKMMNAQNFSCLSVRSSTDRVQP